MESGKQQPVEDKLVAIKAYRRAKGLCFKFILKWAPNHKCAPNVSLNVVEELWPLLQDSDGHDATPTEEGSDSGDDLLCVSLLML